MSLLQNRYGISALSKKFKVNAVPNEILIDKDTAEIQIKSADGNIVSYNYISRLNAHIDTFTFNSYNADIYGNLYELEIGNLDLPCKVEKNTNLLDSTIRLAENSFKSFMMSIDIDAINPNITISKLDLAEIPIDIEITYTVNSVETTILISEALYKINRMKIYRKDLHVDAILPTIKSIKIGSNVLFDGQEKFILHSILVNVEE